MPLPYLRVDEVRIVDTHTIAPIEPHEVRKYHSLTERQREVEGELRQASYDLISQVARAIGRVGA